MARLGKRGINPGGTLSTQEAAIILDVSYPTLLKLLKQKRIPEPKRVGAVRYWTSADIKHAQVVLKELYQNGGLRKGRGGKS